jgi:uncharacterized protein (TIGR00299 family) protein
MKAIYLDIFSGISGDMFLGALIDLGASVDKIKQALSSLKTTFDIKVHRQRRLVPGMNVEVLSHDKVGRKVSDILSLIKKSTLDDWIKTTSSEVFRRIGDVETKMHGSKNVQLHEIGMVDSIVDIVGVVTAIHQLGIDKIYSSPISLGRGFIDSHHGKLAVPVPATIELLRGMPVYFTDIQTELVTPTGAGLLSVLVDEFTYPSFIVDKVGYGMGKRSLPHPNILRVIMGSYNTLEKDSIWEIVANIDDINPEFHQYLLHRLLSQGALDATLTPSMMKKERLGVILTVLCRNENIDMIQDILFQETTTLGIRMRQCDRITLPRATTTVKTRYGTVKVKIGRWKGKVVTISPEYEDCKHIAEKNNVPIKQVYYDAQKEAEKFI